MHELLHIYRSFLFATKQQQWRPEPRVMAHQYLDGVTDVVIHWDDADGHYSAGQTLTGNIEVNVEEVTRFKGVVLKVRREKLSTISSTIKVN